MEALQRQVQQLQDAFSQYKKGESLDLSLSCALRNSHTRGLSLNLELAGPGSRIGWHLV